MKLRKKSFFVILAVLLALSSCQKVPTEVVKANNEELTSFSYNGVEYVERECTSTDEFLPLLSDYSLADFKYDFFNREVYFIDELFISDKRDINQNFIYAYSGILGNTVYERKDFKTPKLANNFEKIDYVIVVYYDTDDDFESDKQMINDPEQVFAILKFLESFENAEIIKNNFYPPENSEVFVRAVSGYYGGEFDVQPESIYFWNGELIAVHNGKQYKAPEEVNEIFRSTKRTKYEWGTQILFWDSFEVR